MSERTGSGTPSGRPHRLEEDTTLSILRTAEMLIQHMGRVLAPWDLTAAQYNVLRILRGAGASGATCKAIGERLITRDPDITRLLDRLARRGLVTRDRAGQDRRFVTVRLTEAGLGLVSELDAPIQEAHAALMKALEAAEMRALIAVLALVRGENAATARP